MKVFHLIAVVLFATLNWSFHPQSQKDHIEAFFRQLTGDGGNWEAISPAAEGDPFTKFIMTFSADGPYSVRGDIKGVKQNGDTTRIWDIWEFPDPSQQNTTVLVQRSDWAYGIGRSIFESGQKREGSLELTWYNDQHLKHRDTHRFNGPDTLISESADFDPESGEWGSKTQLHWIRK